MISRENIFREGDEETVSDDLESIPLDPLDFGQLSAEPKSEDDESFTIKALAEAVEEISVGKAEEWADFSQFTPATEVVEETKDH